MSGFKGKSKARTGSSSSALRSSQKRSGFFAGRSNSASASDDTVYSAGLIRNAIGSLLPDKTDSELTYADIIQVLNGSITDANSSISDTLPPTKALLSLQYDLDKLLKLNAINIEECDKSLSRTKRLSTAIERENTKRAKLNPTVEVVEPVPSAAPPVEVHAAIPKPEESDSKIIIKTEGDSNFRALTTDNIGLEENPNDSQAKPTPEYEKNPKSEFVESQELPISILGLFDENAVEDGIPVNGEEYLKKKYGVASYPKNDLKDQLPGDIPDMDFTKAKPPNQVQFSTFSSYIEPYFRQYTEEDLAFLQQKFVTMPVPSNASSSSAAADPNQVKKALLSPYIIPPLGALYTSTWAAEDGPNPGYNLSPPPMPSKEEVEARGNSDAILDDALETESISCGPLASRLLAALMSESTFDDNIKSDNIKSEEGDYPDHSVKIEDGVSMTVETCSIDDDDVEPVGDTAVSALIDGNWKISSLKTDYGSLEDRLKREFKYVGILDMNLLQKEEKIRQKFEMKFSNTGNGNVPGGGGGGVGGVGVGNGVGVGGGGGQGTPGTVPGGVAGGTTATSAEDFGIDWIKGREDDEVCHEMRILQRELRRVSYLNRAYKHRLYPITQEQMAWQEYSHILEDLDKQVDQAYLRRSRANARPKKKKSLAAHPPAAAAAAASGTSGAAGAAGAVGAGTGAAGAGAASGANPNNLEQPQRLKALLDKRTKWITKIGPVFKSPQQMKRLPSTSIFEGIRYPPVRNNVSTNGTGGAGGGDSTATDANGNTNGNANGNGNGTSMSTKRLAGGADDFEDDELGDIFEEFGGGEAGDENDDLLYGSMIRSTSTPGK